MIVTAQSNEHAGDLERIAKRRVDALNLRAAGANYREIARTLGISTGTAYEDVQAELADLRTKTREAAEDVMALELRRLDSWTKTATLRFNAGSISAGFLLVKYQDNRAKLLGMYAPVRIANLNKNVDDAPVEASIDLSKLSTATLRAILAETAIDMTQQPDGAFEQRASDDRKPEKPVDVLALQTVRTDA